MFPAKLLPLVLLSVRRNVQVGRCWIWAAEDFAPSHLPGRVVSDMSNSCLLPWLAGRVACSLVSEAWESTQILHVWSSCRSCSSNGSLCEGKLPEERSWSKWKYCSTWNWEVFTCCFYFFMLYKEWTGKVRESGPLIKSLCHLKTGNYSWVYVVLSYWRFGVIGKCIQVSLSPVLICFFPLEEDMDIASRENNLLVNKKSAKKTQVYFTILFYVFLYVLLCETVFCKELVVPLQLFRNWSPDP